jgi:hypothetical protein
MEDAPAASKRKAEEEKTVRGGLLMFCWWCGRCMNLSGLCSRETWGWCSCRYISCFTCLRLASHSPAHQLLQIRPDLATGAAPSATLLLSGSTCLTCCVLSVCCCCCCRVMLLVNAACCQEAAPGRERHRCHPRICWWRQLHHLCRQPALVSH